MLENIAKRPQRKFQTNSLQQSSRSALAYPNVKSVKSTKERIIHKVLKPVMLILSSNGMKNPWTSMGAVRVPIKIQYAYFIHWINAKATKA